MDGWDSSVPLNVYHCHLSGKTPSCCGCSRNVGLKRLSCEGEADVQNKEERMSSEMNLNVKC